jgi:hypothetical protein
MEELSASPIIVPLLFLLRCALPLAILILISYLLRKGGWIVGSNNNQHDKGADGNSALGGSTHG